MIFIKSVFCLSKHSLDLYKVKQVVKMKNGKFEKIFYFQPLKSCLKIRI